jgi:hypothetical protein
VHRRETLIGKVRNKGAMALEIAPSKLTATLVNQYLEVKERNLILPPPPSYTHPRLA